MTAATHTPVQAREAGFVGDAISVARRALRSIPRDPEMVIPALIFPVFFFAVNIGALQDIVEGTGGVNFKAFQLPVAIVFAVNRRLPSRHARPGHSGWLLRQIGHDASEAARPLAGSDGS